MEKRTVIAIILSLAVWLVWSYFFIKPKQEQLAPRVATEQPAKTAPQKAETKPAVIAVKPAVTGKEESVEVSTKRYTAVLTNRGAAISSFKFKERGIELVVKNAPHNAAGNFDFTMDLNEDEFLQGGSLARAIWSVQKVSSSEVRFFSNLMLNGVNVRVGKKYLFDDTNNYFKVVYSITNQGGRAVALPGGRAIISPSDFLGPEMDFSSTYNKLESIYSLNNEFEKGGKGGGFFSKETPAKQVFGPTQWVGVMSRYFLLILIPENGAGSGVIYDSGKNTAYRTGIYLTLGDLQPGKEVVKSFKVYVGEKDKEKLRAVGENLVDAADVSKWIEPIRDFLLWSLLKINILLGNLGWSLVVFSILTKVLLMPLTLRSTESMKKLQALNPQINEMREKYKDKPEILNKKIMEVYKKNKVNPASGCLPLLVQMPFFFALYSALINSIDLWHAPFMLWIKDLSLPDTILQIQGFNVNILPILMTGTTYLQQKMTSGDAVGQQQKMLMFMPLIFIVIFWNMPSGLVLYWIMQNVLQILHQLYVNRKGKTEKEQKSS